MGIGVLGLERVGPALVEKLGDEHAFGHRFAVNDQHRAFTLDAHVAGHALADAGQGVALALQQVDPAALGCNAGFSQRSQNGERRAVGFAVIEDHARHLSALRS